MAAQQMHKARELAMQVLYLWDTQGAMDMESARAVAAEGPVDDVVRRIGLEMAGGAWESHPSADQWVERLAPQWPPRRQPAVDRAILRLAVWELTGRPTPPKVVIDEAIELAKCYSTEQSAAFVNGVLDAVLREHRALTSAQPSAEASGGSGSAAEAPAERSAEPSDANATAEAEAVVDPVEREASPQPMSIDPPAPKSER